MPFQQDGLRITQKEILENGVVGDADIPGRTAYEQQMMLDKLAAYIGREKYNALLSALGQPGSGVLTDAEVRQLIAGAVFDAGAGDMTSLIYDPAGKQRDIFAYADAAVFDIYQNLWDVIDGTVAVANGFHTYTHLANEVDPGVFHHILTGSGNNIKVTFTEDWHDGDSIEVNGIASTAVGADGEPLSGGSVAAGGTVLCFLEGTTLNFKTGGGMKLNFQVTAVAGVGSLPETAKENTIAVVSDTSVTAWQFSGIAPAAREEGDALQQGDIWIKTANASPLSFNALKKNSLTVYPQAAYRWNGTGWISVNFRLYQNGQWKSANRYLLNLASGSWVFSGSGGNGYGHNSGGLYWNWVDSGSSGISSAWTGGERFNAAHYSNIQFKGSYSTSKSTSAIAQIKNPAGNSLGSVTLIGASSGAGNYTANLNISNITTDNCYIYIAQSFGAYYSSASMTHQTIELQV